jgi:hypothetical protein
MSEEKRIEERVVEYEEIRKEAAKLYGTFGVVDSPALGQRVQFTAI